VYTSGAGTRADVKVAAVAAEMRWSGRFVLLYSLGLSYMNEDTIRKAVRLLGAQGGRAAAERMTKAQRIARAKKAAAASAKVRSAKANAKKRG